MTWACPLVRHMFFWGIGTAFEDIRPKSCLRSYILPYLGDWGNQNGDGQGRIFLIQHDFVRERIFGLAGMDRERLPPLSCMNETRPQSRAKEGNGILPGTPISL